MKNNSHKFPLTYL